MAARESERRSITQGAAKQRAELVSAFLERTKTQLTYAGLAEIHSTLRENEVGVLYRNLHFATVFKRDGVLYALVTDIGCRRPASFFTPRASRRWRALTRPPAQTASRRTSSGSASTTSAATRTSATRRSNPRRRRRARTPTICWRCSWRATTRPRASGRRRRYRPRSRRR